jgi:class 3 adenylate cyclase/tetratricopeptide (TPR) repeat protein
VICPTCGTANPTGAKFCVECGTRFAAACPSCGATSNPPTARFCAECGTRLGAGDGTRSADGAAPSGRPAGPLVAAAPDRQTERRVVTVLFADLVDFTTLSEARDPEQVREFLARYFTLAREVVERYGGIVEKFIGDAVMALWGAPIAREDDPERAVRAGLELVEAVRHLEGPGGQLPPALRAGVLTGEAAVTLGAEGQGLVAGDLVNTASRLQSVAPPGTVLTGESTVRAADRAIAFEEVGEQALKGKQAPVPAWRAVRVVAERGGLGRSEGIEAPFVGRDEELRLLKEVLHAAGRERRVRLVSVTGQAGVGKSRLAWEFLKYIDGVLEDIYWHQGRSPSFGEGVTFWALGEMVRRRARLAETDDEATTRARIEETLAEYVPDAAERERIEPALLFLLGVGEAPPGGREELFAALRTFFERISIRGTTVLVFEDLQWADGGVLDFIDHLLEWSIGYPILVLTLARPELLDRRPGWGAGRRDLVALTLGALAEPAMRELLTGLVPDLPEATVRSILARADGIPLYAVEMVRMLAVDGRLEEAGGVYRVVGDLGDVRVPGSLQALIASRLDALEPADRALIQDGSVLGQTFSLPALAALTGEPTDTLEGRLRSLVRREILQLDTDPRSPERGQYGFTQALIREVAYATLAKRDRRAKHLAAARYFEALEDEEVAGVLATHYVDAWQAAPEGPEGEAVAAQARIALKAAAERARALGSLDHVVGYLQRAREVTTDPAEDAALLLSIGTAQRELGHFEEAGPTLEAAMVAYQGMGDAHGAASAIERLARVRSKTGDMIGALELLDQAEASLEGDAADPVRVRIWLLQSEYRARREDAAIIDLDDRALATAERLGDGPLIAQAMSLKGIHLILFGRPHEGRALLEAAARLASTEGVWLEAAETSFTLALGLIELDPRAAVAAGRQALELIRRFGLGSLRMVALSNTLETAAFVGDVTWVDDELATVRFDELEPADRAGLLFGRVEIDALRGRPVEPFVDEILAFADRIDDPNMQGAAWGATAFVRLAQGRFEEAYASGMAARIDIMNAGLGLAWATRAAVRLRDAERARVALDDFEAVESRGSLTVLNRAASRAALDGLEGRWTDAAPVFRDVWTRYRELGIDVALAMSQLDCLAVAPPGDPLADEAARSARAILERIGATPYLAQLDALVQEREATPPPPVGVERSAQRAATVGVAEQPQGSS